MPKCAHCDRPVWSRGLCGAHYKKLRKYGNALEPSRKRVKGTCSQCSEPASAKGLCSGHYDKLRRTGKLGGPLLGRMTRLERYLSFVDQRGPDDCWPWTLGKSEQNYGQYADGENGSMRAHRYGFAELVRPLEPGETVDHTCHNRDAACLGGDTCEHRLCQNPAHWEAVPPAENVRRGFRRKTCCKWGHELTPENSYGYKGRRQCKTCARLAGRGAHPRQLAAQQPALTSL
jgi:hypothetical protein